MIVRCGPDTEISNDLNQRGHYIGCAADTEDKTRDEPRGVVVVPDVEDAE